MSYANFPANVVVSACEHYLTARDARIERECEQEITRWTGAKLWFWSRPMTRDQAEEYCYYELFNIRITGGSWARDIEDLLALAKVAEKCNTSVVVDARLSSVLQFDL